MQLLQQCWSLSSVILPRHYCLWSQAMLPQVLSSHQNATTVSSAQEGLPSFQVTAVSHNIWNESSLDCPVQVFKAGTLGESEIWSLPNQGMAIAMYSWQVLPGRSVKEHSKVYIGGALKTVGTLSSACGWKKHWCKFPLKNKTNHNLQWDCLCWGQDNLKDQN